MALGADHDPIQRFPAHGWQIVRGTWIDLDERPEELAADVWALLLARSVA